MNDNALNVIIRAELIAGLARLGVTADVIAAYQPTSQGRESDATVYFFQVGDNRYGWQYRTQVYDQEAGEIVRTEKQIIETTYQLMALAPQDPSNLSLPTPKDIVRACAMICNSQAFIVALRAHDIGMQRVTQIRNPYFVNDREQFEASPSFDFTVTHNQVIIDTTPAVSYAEFNQTRV